MWFPAIQIGKKRHPSAVAALGEFWHDRFLCFVTASSDFLHKRVGNRDQAGASTRVVSHSKRLRKILAAGTWEVQ
jgi:hypothetical protein